MIRGRRITLRKWEEKDIPVFTMIRNDVELQSQLLARARGSSVRQVQDWLEGRTSNPNQIFFVIACNSNDEPLGFVQIIDIDFPNRRGELGIGLVRSFWGKGLGTEAMGLMLEHCRQNTALTKIGLKVRSDNSKAIESYAALGFSKVGVLKRHTYLDCHWHDVLIMEIFLGERGVPCE